MKENEETWKEVYWDGEGKTCVEKRRKVKKKNPGVGVKRQGREEARWEGKLRDTKGKLTGMDKTKKKRR